MRFLFADETNTEPTDEVEFFIYGGLVLTDEQLVSVHEGVLDIRAEFGLTPDEVIKFADRARPERFERDEWRLAKNRVIDLLTEVDATFIAYLIHHRVTGENMSIRNEYALNTLLWAFEKYVRTVTDHALVVLDPPNLQSERLTLACLATEGLDMGGGRMVPLNHIVGLAVAQVDYSMALSACDVLLGAFRYCVNNPTHDVTIEMFGKIAPLLWYNPANAESRHVREFGLFLRPQNVRVPAISERYDELVEELQRLSNSGEQDDAGET